LELFGLGKRFIAKRKSKEVKIVTCPDLNCVGRGDTNARSSHSEKKLEAAATSLQWAA